MPIEGNGMHDQVRTAEARHDEPRREYTKDSLRDTGWMLKQLRDGQRVRRAGWNGKGMWLVLITHNWSGAHQEPRNMPADWIGYGPFVAMYTADKVLVPWLCSQTDMLAADWELA